MALAIIPRTALLMALCLGTPLAMAEIYKHVDKDGNVSFSDSRQSDDSEVVEVKPAQGINLPRPQQRPQQQTRTEEEAEPRDAYNSVRITKPEHDTAFWRNSGNITIEVSSDPSLRNGHQYQLELGGEIKDTTTSNAFGITNIDRGTHEAVVHIINRSGERIASSELTRFTVHRASVLN